MMEKKAIEIVQKGHNLLILGAAGTGKTQLLKTIANTLQHEGKTVYITASTGIACCQYKTACTVHKWSGIGDGRHGGNIWQIVKHNASYSDVRQRVLKTDTLIIDECSMISKAFFESLNEVCKLKQPNLPFGGIQIVLCGDFTQLPPVPNVLYGETGAFCFESELFKQVFSHRVVLSEVKRQTEKDLIKTIHEVAMGKLSEESETFIKSLKRPIDKHSIKLFSQNDQVNSYNRSEITEFPGELYEFISKDTGELKYLNKVLVPKILWLKKCVPVMLLRNLSDKLVNGLRGTVVDIVDRKPVVHFPTLDINVPLEKAEFSVFHPGKNSDVATRLQYPIKLCFAMTIHKSQGLTLDSVAIDCTQIFKPGQLAVAIGRVRHSEGLQVINFNSQKCVIPQPLLVTNFLAEKSTPTIEDQTCCRLKSLRAIDDGQKFSSHLTVRDMMELDEALEVDVIDDEDFDKEFEEVVELLDEIETKILEDIPEDLNIHEILNSIECQIVKTPKQYITNNILKEINITKYQLFCRQEHSKLKQMIDDMKIDNTKPVSNKQLTELYSKIHVYHTSAEFKMNCVNLFENEPFSEEHLHICFNTSVEIRKYILAKQAQLFPSGNRRTNRRSVTNTCDARVRYVGGYCVSKVRNEYMQKKSSNMYKTDENGQQQYDESKIAVDIMNSLKVDEHYIFLNTENPSSLLDTARKQQINRSLTNISDELFCFFQQLTEKCLQMLISDNVNRFGSNIFQHMQDEIVKNEELSNKFLSTVNTFLGEEFDGTKLEIKQKVLDNIYLKILQLFMMVLLNQFRKDLLDTFQVEKKMAHRKQVRVSSKPKSSSQQPQASSSQEDTADNASCKTTRKRKCAIEDDISVVETQPNTATNDNDDSEDSCKVCNLNQYQAPSLTQWIYCDKCDQWLHRKCAGLQNHLRWKKFNKTGVKFYCNDRVGAKV